MSRDDTFMSDEAERVAAILNAHSCAYSRTDYGGEDAAVCFQMPGLEIWVYEDGAGIHGAHIDSRYEKWDFASLDHLSQAFENELRAILDYPGGIVSFLNDRAATKRKTWAEWLGF